VSACLPSSASAAVSNASRVRRCSRKTAKTFRIQSDIQTGAKYGMVTLDSFLIEKYPDGMIAREEVTNKRRTWSR
jgi:Tfp pilus assembly pilus retraction ATPase PilT